MTDMGTKEQRIKDAGLVFRALELRMLMLHGRIEKSKILFTMPLYISCHTVKLDSGGLPILTKKLRNELKNGIAALEAEAKAGPHA